jgi:hypothetical protein
MMENRNVRIVTAIPGPASTGGCDTLMQVIRDAASDLLPQHSLVAQIHRYLECQDSIESFALRSVIFGESLKHLDREEAEFFLELLEGLKSVMSDYQFQTLDQLDRMFDASEAYFGEVIQQELRRFSSIDAERRLKRKKS